jgi:hypothetical protein
METNRDAQHRLPGMTGMTRRVLAISAIGWMLAALMSLYAGSARAASRVVLRPPPRVVVRVPAVRPQQQLSFWGVTTNVQQYRDDLQPAPPPGPRKHSRRRGMKSANRKQ